MKNIDIMFCFNRNAWMQASVAIASLLRSAHNKCAYNIHIVCPSDVDNAIKSQLLDLLIPFPGSRIDFTVPPDSLLKDTKVAQNWQKIFYYRLLAPLLFPHIKKIIYFDTDIIFTKDLLELDEIDITGYPVAGVVDYWYPKPDIELYQEYGVYDLFNHCRYINSGMLVLNLEEMRKQHISEQCLEFIAKHQVPIFDQDTINIICRNKIKYLPMKYNRGAYYTPEYCEKYRKILHQSPESLKDDLENYAVLHYIGFKPEGAKTIGQWHNDIWWAECAKLPHIYDIMRQKQLQEIQKEKKTSKILIKKIFKKFSKFIFKIKNFSGKKKIYILGIRVFSYKPKERISLYEQEQLDHIAQNFPKIMPLSKMLQQIKSGASLCRFGDAEFDIALNHNADDPYQKSCPVLSKKLLSILSRKSSKKLIVAIPPFNAEHNNIKNFYKNISFWQWYWLNRWETLKNFFTQKNYGNSFFSRDAVFYELPVQELKSIWSNRHIVFVVPKNGRFFYDDRLFDNIKSKHEIHIPATSAYAEYDRILSECLNYPKEYLFFICAGPTATILATELSDNGYQALDMGHFPNCYKQFLGEAKAPESYPMQY